MSGLGPGGAPIRLRVDGRFPVDGREPRLIHPALSAQPRLSWQLPLRRAAQRQDAYEVQVLTRESLTQKWESGVVRCAESAVTLPIRLGPNSMYSWRVRVLGDDGAWSAWSAACHFETGPLTPADWQARWVTVSAGSVVGLTWELASPVRRARLYVTAQGLVRATLNGERVNTGSADPSRTDRARALFRTYDIAADLRQGANRVDLTVARGHWEAVGEDPRLLASVLIDEDGEDDPRMVGTGPGMVVHASEVMVEERFYLERHDNIGARSRVVESVRITDEIPSSVEPDPGPAIRAVQRFEPTAEYRLAGGSRIFDFGTNIAGRTRLRLGGKLPAGSVVRLKHGEYLDAAGHVDTTNISMPFDAGRPRQVLELVAVGDVEEEIAPWFAYYGFRYVEVEGVPEGIRIDLDAQSFHSDLEQTATFASDSPVLATLESRASRTLLNNAHGLPEDCPTREQAGWGGDAAAAADYATARFDMQGFYDKWIDDVLFAQKDDGEIPAVAPNLSDPGFPGEPIYSSALHRVLVAHWLHYGDERRVRRSLPALERWADYQLRFTGIDGVISEFPMSYGQDWLGLEQTPPSVHHTAAVIECLDSLAFLLEELDAGDASRRRAQAESLRFAGRATFFDEERGTFGNGSQGAYAAGLIAGMIPSRCGAEAVRRIVADIRAHGNRVTTGYATTRDLVRTLAAHGRSDVIFDVLRQVDEPGVGAMLDHGPGTLWEAWWRDPSNAGTGSLDHVGLAGPFASWLFRDLAGIAPVERGYRRFRFEPSLLPGVSTLTVEMETTRGTIHMRMLPSSRGRQIELTVPVGTSADVRLPGRQPQELGAGTHALEVSEPKTGGHTAAQVAWSPPPRSSRAVDVVHGSALLEEAFSRATAQPGRGSSVAALERPLLCKPMPHAQMLGPILRVAGGSWDRASVVFRFGAPAPLAGVRFVYASIDLCETNLVHPVEPYLILRGSDGTVRQGTARLWPASWNRLTLDLAKGPAAIDVTEIEVGLRFEDSGQEEAVFHVGEMGFSHAMRTW